MYILFIIALILAAVTLVVGPFVITYAVLSRVKNRENAELRNEAEAHRKILESTYDHIWRTIKQRGGLTEGNRRSFNNIYPDLINNSIDDSEFLDWLLDCNPNLDPSEYLPLVDVIKEDRERFVAHQKRMMNLIAEHRELVTKWPGKMVVKDKSAIRYVPIDTDHDRWGKSL
jgi:hypothetical protein